MKALLCTLIFATSGAIAANAASVTVTFDQPAQAATPGATLKFFGTIKNSGNAIVYLNADDLNFAAPGFTTTDQFYTTVPISLAPAGQAGNSSGDIELFDITVSSPFTGGPGAALGTYTLFGGIDGNGQDNLGSTSFSLATPSISSTPEPSALYLVLGGLTAIAAPVSRKLRARP